MLLYVVMLVVQYSYDSTSSTGVRRAPVFALGDGLSTRTVVPGTVPCTLQLQYHTANRDTWSMRAGCAAFQVALFASGSSVGFVQYLVLRVS